MDYKSYGLPDMSFHGTKAWYADFSNFNRHFSAMYCGKYAQEDGRGEETDIIVAYNMFWKPIKFGIPSARDKKQWKIAFTTENPKNIIETDVDKLFTVGSRSITVLIAE